MMSTAIRSLIREVGLIEMNESDPFRLQLILELADNADEDIKQWVADNREDVDRVLKIVAVDAIAMLSKELMKLGFGETSARKAG